MERNDEKSKDHNCRDDHTFAIPITGFESYRTEYLKAQEYVSNVLEETAPYANYPYRSTPLYFSESDETSKYSDSELQPEGACPPESSSVSTETSADSSSSDDSSISGKLSISQPLCKNLKRKDSSSADSNLQTSPIKTLRKRIATPDFIRDPFDFSDDPSYIERNQPEWSTLEELRILVEKERRAIEDLHARRKRKGTLTKLDICKAFEYAVDNKDPKCDSGCSSASSTFTPISEHDSSVNMKEKLAAVKETQLTEPETHTGELVAEDKTPTVPETSPPTETLRPKSCNPKY